MYSKKSSKKPPISAYTTGGFSVDELAFIQIASVRVLATVVAGELDLNLLAREELISRGLDEKGRWVGFDRARQAHNLKKQRVSR